MSRERTSDLRVGGPKLWARFTLSMTIALTIVLGIAGISLYKGALKLAETVQERALVSAVKILAENPEWEQEGTDIKTYRKENVQRAVVRYGLDRKPGIVYRHKYSRNGREAWADLIVPGDIELTQRAFLGLILGMFLLILVVGAAVAFFIANQVAQPIESIVLDIGQIASGDFKHRTKVRTGGEVALLARSVDRMAKNLQEGQETELELSIREREVEVAAEVREALLPQETPGVEGYGVGSIHIASEELGGDFFDFLELPDGRLGALVCDVSGTGLPAALVGATARAYLRRELEGGGDVAEVLRKVNRTLHQDVRRGMYVTALYVLLDPVEAIATVACAGHKLPLIRIAAEDGKVRLIHPDGIGLGFDAGSMFDSRLEIQHVPVDPGDRLVLANTGAVVLANEEGVELGEKKFYTLTMRHGAETTDRFLAHLEGTFNKYAGEAELARDIAVVTIARDA